MNIDPKEIAALDRKKKLYKIEMKAVDSDPAKYSGLTAKSKQMNEQFKSFTYAADQGKLLPHKDEMIKWINDCVSDHDQVIS